MKKTSLIGLLALMMCAGKSNAQAPQQPCGSDEMHIMMRTFHPEIAAMDAEMERQIAENIKKIDLRRAGLRTRSSIDESGDTGFVYNIPIVVHIIHDYGDEYMPDDSIFDYLKNWNIVYAEQNYDTSNVIPCFKKWIGNPHIKLHLATVDPYGNPTKGITRHRSYLTYYGGDQSKFDDWDPTSYVNIWFINTMSFSNSFAAAYAYFPSEAASDPTGDGVIALYNYAANAYDSDPNGVSKTINHELGHVFSLYHPWGGTNQPGAAYNTCADGGTDLVDDTPPTIGHLYGGCATAPGSALWDTVCATDYFKVYTSADGTLDSLVNYPDTTNAQNIMDYTYCARMFTKGQVVRMHAALNSPIAGRVNLWSDSNLSRTGALAPLPDLLPIPEFNVTYNTLSNMQYFTCPGTPLNFINKSWNDTVTAVKWAFQNGTATITDTLNMALRNYISQSFSQSGWVNITMSATGNHTGTASKVYDSSVFVAAPTGTVGTTLVEEFDPAGDLAQWPSFNYYNNEFKWEQCSVAGVYDSHCMKYDGFDNRIIPGIGYSPSTGTPYGDFDDLFSVPVDLSGMATGVCNLNFWTSGASRSSNSLDINDTLQIYYSVDKGKNWIFLKALGRNDIANKGAIPTAYTPSSIEDWIPQSISLPTGAARGNYVVFRFRYRPGCYMSSPYTSLNGITSSGNNFYLDRVSFSPYPASVSNVPTKSLDIVVAPNPTDNNAYVIIKDVNNASAKVVVSDVTGKIVYTTTQQVIGNDAHIEIPASAISVKGVYMVQATTGNQTSTQKLVVY